MVSYFKQLVNKRQFELVLTSTIVLVALISFGLGRLTATSNSQKPIIIEQPASMVSQIPIEEKKTSTGTITAVQFVASVKGTKYHWPNCPSAKKILPANQVWFSSETEAQSAGYTRCASFEKYAPAGYQP